MTNEEAKGRLESFIDTFNICKEHDNSLVAVSISKEDVQAFKQAIKALEQQPCEDAVSRHDALNCVTGNEVRYRMVNDIRALPSVTPKEKTAAWVPTDEEPHEVYECNACGWLLYDVDRTDFKYCPNCGARMVSE
jgi:rubrerythrin